MTQHRSGVLCIQRASVEMDVLRKQNTRFWTFTHRSAWTLPFSARGVTGIVRVSQLTFMGVLTRLAILVFVVLLAVRLGKQLIRPITFSDDASLLSLFCAPAWTRTSAACLFSAQSSSWTWFRQYSSSITVCRPWNDPQVGDALPLLEFNICDELAASSTKTTIEAGDSRSSISPASSTALSRLERCRCRNHNFVQVLLCCRRLLMTSLAFILLDYAFCARIVHNANDAPLIPAQRLDVC